MLISNQTYCRGSTAIDVDDVVNKNKRDFRPPVILRATMSCHLRCDRQHTHFTKLVPEPTPTEPIIRTSEKLSADATRNYPTSNRWMIRETPDCAICGHTKISAGP